MEMLNIAATRLFLSRQVQTKTPPMAALVN
jgi:hypothetical protein